MAARKNGATSETGEEHIERWRRPAPKPDLKWQTPPAAARGPTAYDESVPDKLRARPGKWALIKTANFANSASAYAKSRRERWGPTFEIVCRGREVYARFVGGIPDTE